MSTPGTVHLLRSPDAGRGRGAKAFGRVLDTLAADGRRVIDLTGPTAAASLASARAAVEAGSSRLVVAGGDGLVHLAVQAVAGTDTVLGIVPVGTGNDFARGLATVPDDIEAATVAALGPDRAHDAIRADDGWIASVATAGFSGDVNARANRLVRPRGPSRYSVATLLELPRLRPRRVTLTVDGVEHHHEAVLFAVGNTGWFGGGMHICPAADPTDGRLEVTVVGAIGRAQLLRFFRLVFAGRHLDHPRVHTLTGREVRLAGEPLELWGDGEPVGALPVTLEAVPGALRIAGA